MLIWVVTFLSTVVPLTFLYILNVNSNEIAALASVPVVAAIFVHVCANRIKTQIVPSGAFELEIVGENAYELRLAYLKPINLAGSLQYWLPIFGVVFGCLGYFGIFT